MFGIVIYNFFYEINEFRSIFSVLKNYWKIRTLFLKINILFEMITKSDNLFLKYDILYD